MILMIFLIKTKNILSGWKIFSGGERLPDCSQLGTILESLNLLEDDEEWIDSVGGKKGPYARRIKNLKKIILDTLEKNRNCEDISDKLSVLDDEIKET